MALEHFMFLLAGYKYKSLEQKEFYSRVRGDNVEMGKYISKWKYLDALRKKKCSLTIN